MAKREVKIGALVEHEETGEIGTIIQIVDGEVMIKWNFGEKNFESPSSLIFLR